MRQVKEMLSQRGSAKDHIIERIIALGHPRGNKFLIDITKDVLSGNGVFMNRAVQIYREYPRDFWMMIAVMGFLALHRALQTKPILLTQE